MAKCAATASSSTAPSAGVQARVMREDTSCTAECRTRRGCRHRRGLCRDAHRATASANAGDDEPRGIMTADMFFDSVRVPRQHCCPPQLQQAHDRVQSGAHALCLWVSPQAPWITRSVRAGAAPVQQTDRGFPGGQIKLANGAPGRSSKAAPLSRDQHWEGLPSVLGLHKLTSRTKSFARSWRRCS